MPYFTEMHILPLPDLNYLKECFEIDASLPCGLRWASKRPLFHFKNEADYKRWSSKNSNKPAGSISSNGYYYSKFNKKAYRNSRIIFAIYNNTIDFQDKQVDHIDGNVLNNSPQNLRLVTSSQNQFNRKKQKNNTSGHRNIYFYKKNPKKYTCAFKLNKKQIYVGIFDSLELAIEAKNKKLKELPVEFYRV